MIAQGRSARRTAILVTALALANANANAGEGGMDTAMRFTDVTAQSGIDFTMTSGQTPSRHILEVNGGGVALIDYDADGDLDLFFANGATLPAPEQGPGSRLYANDGGGKYRDVTASVGIRLTRWAMGVAVGDYDRDGDDDLYVTCYGPNVLLRNDVAKSGRFVDVGQEAGVADARWGTSAAFGDVDGDGDPDLYVVNYLRFDRENPPDRSGKMFLGAPVMAGPSGLEPQGDVLYENLGNGKFRDVTSAWGCDPEVPGYGLGVVMLDVDRDGRLDIFVGNDSTENFLFRNLGERKFRNVGTLSGVASNYDGGNQATMGIAVADVDDNGFPDLFTTNFSSDTNTLHLNLGGKFFDDRTSQFGLAMVSRRFLGWGAGFRDFDSDGDADLLFSNGHVYPEAATHKMDSTYEQPPLLFERRGKRFAPTVSAGPMFTTPYSGRATAFGDIDSDGDEDVVMTTLNDKVRVFRNDAAQADVAVIRVVETEGGRHPNGTVVEILAGETIFRRWIGGGSFQSVDAPEAIFGVSGLTNPGLRVVWPDGTVSEYSSIPINRLLTVRRGAKTFESAALRGRRSPS